MSPWSAACLVGMSVMFRAANPAWAQHGDSDFQIWPGVTVKAPMADQLELTADLIAMCTADCSRPGQALARAMIDYRVSPRLAIGGGYTYFWADDGLGARFKEHRAVAEVNFQPSSSLTAATLAARIRLEERGREGNRESSQRLRVLARAEAPLPVPGLAAIVWCEPFYLLNRTRWAGGTGFSFVQSFLGFGVALSKSATLESGYLNQTYLDPGDDRVRHVAAAFVVVRL